MKCFFTAGLIYFPWEWLHTCFLGKGKVKPMQIPMKKGKFANVFSKLSEGEMPYEIASTIDEYQSLPEKVYNEVIWLTNASKKTTLNILQEMLEKQLFWKFWKIIRKTFLVVFLLKASSCPSHPPITITKTDSSANVSFVCSKNIQNCW